MISYKGNFYDLELFFSIFFFYKKSSVFSALSHHVAYAQAQNQMR